MAIVLVMTAHETQPLVEIVAEEQHQVISADTSGEVLGHVIHHHPDVIIIPEKAEPVEGVDLLAVLRRMTRAAIIVVGPGGESRMAQSLLQGADLYVPTPVVPRQLQVRLRALLRPRRSASPVAREEPKEGGDQDKDEKKDLFRGLSHREVQLLTELLERRGAVVPPDDLLFKVWGDVRRTSSLRLYISRLRAKIATHGFQIQTCKGIGYRLVPLPDGPAAGW